MVLHGKPCGRVGRCRDYSWEPAKAEPAFRRLSIAPIAGIVQDLGDVSRALDDLEGLDVASDRAEQLASELGVVMPELKAKGCAVRVTDSDNKELYRTPLDPIPAWMRPHH